MPWKECTPMNERVKFIGCHLAASMFIPISGHFVCEPVLLHRKMHAISGNNLILLTHFLSHQRITASLYRP